MLTVNFLSFFAISKRICMYSMYCRRKVILQSNNKTLNLRVDALFLLFYIWEDHKEPFNDWVIFVEKVTLPISKTLDFCL